MSRRASARKSRLSMFMEGHACLDAGKDRSDFVWLLSRKFPLDPEVSGGREVLLIMI